MHGYDHLLCSLTAAPPVVREETTLRPTRSRAETSARSIFQRHGDLREFHRTASLHNALLETFSLDRYNAMKQRLDSEVHDCDAVAMRAWENEINRRLYGR